MRRACGTSPPPRSTPILKAISPPSWWPPWSSAAKPRERIDGRRAHDRGQDGAQIPGRRRDDRAHRACVQAPRRRLEADPDARRLGPRPAVIWLLALVLLVYPATAAAQCGTGGVVITACSCQGSDVQTAFNAVSTITTQINIPAGTTCVWSDKVSLNLPAGIGVPGGTVSVIGPGNLTVDGGGGANVIEDQRTNVNESLFDVLQNDNNRSLVIRVAGLTLKTQNPSTTYKNQGLIKFVGVGQFRLDHNTFNLNGATMWALHGWLAHGVADHNVVLNTGGQPNGGLIFTHYVGAQSIQDSEGDGPWSEITGFGTQHFYFVENNTVNGNIADCDHGAKVVVRNNTINDASGLSTHGTGQEDDRARGCRAQEFYNNTFVGATGFRVMAFITGGPALVWGNTVPAAFTWLIRLYNARHSNGADSQTNTPNGWGNCGSNQANGVASGWDGNTPSAAIGYPCLDQPGRGRGQMITGAFPNAVNQTTGTIAWPNQALEPIYEWNNSQVGATYAPFEGETLQENRDYYQANAACTATSCLSGVGIGAAAPTGTCTPGVAYWQTSNTTLHQCQPGGTWLAVYVPYTYPHPLVGGPQKPAPPANLRITSSVRP